MADKPKSKRGEARPAEALSEEAPLVLDPAQLALEQARARLPQAARESLRATLDLRERLRREVVQATPEQRKKNLHVLEEEEQKILAEQVRIAGTTTKKNEFSADERARYAALAEQAEREAAHLEAEASEYRSPELYFTMQKIRAVEMEEYKKLTTDNKDELIAFFEDALEERDVPRVAAIMRKLTNDANENELTNWYGYPSNMQGLHDFFNEVLIGRRAVLDPATGKQKVDPRTSEPVFEKFNGPPPPLGMGEQEALALESDISYAAEKVGHWEVARLVKKVGTRFVQMTEQEHADECLAEIAKTPDPRGILRKYNRLSWGGEMPLLQKGMRPEEQQWLMEKIKARAWSEIAARYRRSQTRSFTPSRLGFRMLVNFGDYMAERWVELNMDVRQKMANFLDRDPQHVEIFTRYSINTTLIKNLQELATGKPLFTDRGKLGKLVDDLYDEFGLETYGLK